MNKCLMCENMISKDGKIRCLEYKSVLVVGELGNEPIVESCGHYKPMHAKTKPAKIVDWLRDKR